MASHGNLHPVLVFTSFILFSVSSFIKPQPIGFSVDLIHCDSPNSPLFDPSITPSHRLRNVFRRSISRASYFRQVLKISDDTQSEITPNSLGVYIMKISIGMPPHDIFAAFDTSTDLTWVQCTPCENCFKQNQPLFDHTSSKSYQDMLCQAQPCKNLGRYDTIHALCDVNSDSTCHYQAIYNNHSSISGDLVFDTFTFISASGTPFHIPRIVFGCVHNNSVPFPEVISGIAGLGGGLLSIINQLGTLILGQFSYCLARSDNATSKINFGSGSIVSGPGVVSTPLVTKAPKTLYHVFLEGISVKTPTSRHRVIQYRTEKDSSEVGNMIIDSGTALTLLPRDFYNRVESMLRRVMKGKPISNPPEPLTLCYKIEDKVVLPNLVYHFGGGALLELSPHNSFVEIEELVCWAVAAVDDDIVVFGSLSQTDFLVGLDLFNKQVSFKPTDCTNQ